MKRKLPLSAVMPTEVRKLRCAIYTRVSTDESWGKRSTRCMPNATLAKPMLSVSGLRDGYLHLITMTTEAFPVELWNDQLCNGYLLILKPAGSIRSFVTKSIAYLAR